MTTPEGQFTALSPGLLPLGPMSSRAFAEIFRNVFPSMNTPRVFLPVDAQTVRQNRFPLLSMEATTLPSGSVISMELAESLGTVSFFAFWDLDNWASSLVIRF